MAQVPREDRDEGKQCGGQEDVNHKRCEFAPLSLLGVDQIGGESHVLR